MAVAIQTLFEGFGFGGSGKNSRKKPRGKKKPQARRAGSVRSLKGYVSAGSTTSTRKRRPVKKKTKTAGRSQVQVTPAQLQWLSMVAVSMVLGGALLWLYTWINNHDNLPIQRVDWQNEFTYLEQAELQELIEPYVGTNLYLLDGVALEEELEAHPWIRGASLRRAWPNQLVVNIEEQVPIAFWGEGQLLNQFGEVFTADLSEKIGVFPVIHSPKSKGREMAEQYVEFTRAIHGLGLEIVELTEDERGLWKMKLSEGQDVIVGQKEQQKRIERFRVGYMQALKSRFADIRTIDLRYTNGFAIEWKQGRDKAGVVSTLGVYSPQGNGG